MLGEKHPDYATSLNNLAMLHEAMGAYARAEPLLRQALDISQDNLELAAAVRSSRCHIIIKQDPCLDVL